MKIKLLLVQTFILITFYSKAQCDITFPEYVAPLEICASESITLTASASTTISWYNQNYELLGSGESYTTAPIDIPQDYSYYAKQEGCDEYSEVQFTVHPLPVIEFVTLEQAICIDAGPVILSNTPLQTGVFSGIGISGNVFDPEIAGPGLHEISYTETSEFGCTQTVSFTIRVIEPALPIVSDQITTPDFLVQLEATSPDGGTITWYADSMGSTVLAVGNTYQLPFTGAGVYQVFVSNTFLGCESDLVPCSMTIVACEAPAPELSSDTVSIQYGDPAPTFEVTNNTSNYTTRWYKDGILVQESSLSYTPAETMPGFYFYDVSFFDVNENCEGPLSTITYEIECGIDAPQLTQTEYTVKMGEPMPTLSVVDDLEPDQEIHWYLHGNYETGITFTPELEKIGAYTVQVGRYDTQLECYNFSYATVNYIECMAAPVIDMNDSSNVIYIGDPMPTFTADHDKIIWTDSKFNEIATGQSFTPHVFETGKYLFYAKSKDGQCESEYTPINLYIESYNISGYVYVDNNNNQNVDYYDQKLANQSIYINELQTYVNTNASGYYNINISTIGTYTLTYTDPENKYVLASPSTISVTIDQNTPNSGNRNFIVESANIFDISVDLTSTSPVVGRNVTQYIDIDNHGKMQKNINIVATFDNTKSSFVSSSVEYLFQAGNTVEFMIDSLPAMESIQLYYTLQVNPDWQLTDSILRTDITATSTNTDVSIENNTDSLFSKIRNSWDPNDKSVSPSFKDEGYVLMNSKLEYLIRFQNKGTAEAYDIYVVDTLDDNLDLSSFKLISWSHDVHYSIDKRIVTFYFDNIMLPAQINDDEGSNGFVKYTINPKADLPEDTKVENTAYIYFDFNPAVITNTTQSTYVEQLPIQKPIQTKIDTPHLNGSISLYPVPVKDVLHITVYTEGQKTVQIFNVIGIKLKEQSFNTYTTEINCSGLQTGAYIVQISVDNDIVSSKMLTVE